MVDLEPLTPQNTRRTYIRNNETTVTKSSAAKFRLLHIESSATAGKWHPSAEVWLLHMESSAMAGDGVQVELFFNV